MIYPKFLSKGDTIGIIAPSSGSYDSKNDLTFQNAIKKLNEQGYKTLPSKNLYKLEKGRSADAKTRGDEVNEMFTNPEVDFVEAAAGGCFLVECLPYVDFDKITKTPKFLQGFSDPTGLIYPLTTKYDVATIYGRNLGTYGMNEYTRDVKENLEIITGNLVEQQSYEKYEKERNKDAGPYDGYNLTENVEWKVLDGTEAEIKGRVIAGCFDVITNLIGTKYDGAKDFIERYKDDGVVWIFDVCEFALESLICYLWQMNELGYFKYCKGIAFGRIGNDITYEEYTIEEALKDSVVSKIGIPIIYDMDVSHRKPNMTIINGALIDITAKDGKGTIKQELK